MKFLVVDDQSTMRSLLKGMLTKMGFTDVEEADDGEVGLNKVQREKYDLVISDIHMTKMSGLEFLKETRRTTTIKDTRFLLVTTESSKSAVLEAIKLKVNGYIIKPFTFDALQAKLKSLGIEAKAASSEPAGDIGKWLESLQLQQYVEAFTSNDIKMENLVQLKENDLKELGVSSLGHRKTLMSAIEKLANPASQGGA